MPVGELEGYVCSELREEPEGPRTVPKNELRCFSFLMSLAG